MLAWAAGSIQAIWIPEPTREVVGLPALWVGAAAIGLVASRPGDGGPVPAVIAVGPEQTWIAVEQFLPCVVAGGCLTLVIARSAEERSGCSRLWSILFGLGIFASRRLLPRATLAWPLLPGRGSGRLGLARGGWALSPWAMGIPFGGGQFLAAIVLYQTLERPDGDE